MYEAAHGAAQVMLRAEKVSRFSLLLEEKTETKARQSQVLVISTAEKIHSPSQENK